MSKSPQILVTYRGGTEGRIYTTLSNHADVIEYQASLVGDIGILYVSINTNDIDDFISILNEIQGVDIAQVIVGVGAENATQ